MYLVKNPCGSWQPVHGIVKLSARQIEVLHLLSTGLMQKQIAVDLKISHKTVSSIVRVLKEKLGIENERKLFLIAVDMARAEVI